MSVLDVPAEHIFQKDSSSCGACCLKMIYKLCGVDVSLEEVLKELGFGPSDTNFYSYLGQLGLHLVGRGLQTKITISNPRLLLPSWNELPKEQLIENIETWMGSNTEHQWHIEGVHIVKYLRAGGDIELKPFSADLIKRMIKGGALLLAGVDEAWIWGHRFKEGKLNDATGTSTGHFIVVKGLLGDGLEVLDPYPTNLQGRHGAYSLSCEEFVAASLLWDGMLLEVLHEDGF